MKDLALVDPQTGQTKQLGTWETYDALNEAELDKLRSWNPNEGI